MNVRLVVSHVLLERTTSSIADRQARKSETPAQIVMNPASRVSDESCFRLRHFAFSRIPYRILVISRIPKMPFHTVSYGEITRRFNSYLWSF